jgi:hypothetical protein
MLSQALRSIFWEELWWKANPVVFDERPVTTIIEQGVGWPNKKPSQILFKMIHVQGGNSILKIVINIQTVTRSWHIDHFHHVHASFYRKAYSGESRLSRAPSDPLWSAVRYWRKGEAQSALVSVTHVALNIGWIRVANAHCSFNTRYKDANATIRRTSAEHQFQLVVARIFEEGEDELDADDLGNDAILVVSRVGARANAGWHVDDERVFLIDHSMNFRKIDDGKMKQFAWEDPVRS